MHQSVSSEGKRPKPSWCFEVMTMYFIPAFLATSTHSLALNFTGLNRAANFSYSETGIWVVSRNHSA